MEEDKNKNLYFRGIKKYETKQYDEAIEIFKELVSLDSNNSDAYANIAVIKKIQGDFKSSFEYLKKAIEINPKNPQFHGNMGNLLRDVGNFKNAIKAYAVAIKLNPKDAMNYNNLGIAYEKIGDDNKAILAYKEAVRHDENFAKAINNIGVILYKQKKYQQAVDIFKITLKTDPKYYEVYSNIGACLNKLKKYDEAIRALDTAIKYNPQNGGAYTNLGNVYNKIYEYKKAAKLHEKSIELEPKGSNAYSNVGTSYKNLNFTNKAIESYKKAIELEPNFENAHFDLATVYLSKSDYLNGWKEYEWRFKKDEMKSHIFKHKDIFLKPRFTGVEDIKDKKLLVHSEQGFGDSIQFVRFVYLLKEKYGCYVILQARDELEDLFENSIEGVDYFYPRDTQKTPQFDYQIAMLSLPYLFKMKTDKEIPIKMPYLKSTKDEEIVIPKKKGKIDIGICWSASITGESYDGKVFDLKYLEPLINNKKLNIYSLQVGDEKSDIKKYGYEDKIIDITHKLNSFKKTASFIDQLDLVISSDTSVAHLSGALNKEVWIPLQKVPDWRWANKGEKSHWYPSAKLFRQKTNRVWDSVFQSIYAKLGVKFKIKIK